MRHLDTLERAALALLLALAAGPGLAASRIPLGEAHRKAITSTRTVANLAQEEMGTSYNVLWAGNSIAGMTFAAVGNEHREREAREGAARLADALGAFDPRPRMKTALERELGKLAAFRGTRVEVTHEMALAGPSAGAVAARGGADAVLVVDLRYGFNANFEFLVVSAKATLLPTASAADPELKKAFGSSTRELPVTPLYQSLLMTSMPAPGEGDDVDRWMVEKCAPARLAIEGGIEMLDTRWPPLEGPHAGTGPPSPATRKGSGLAATGERAL